MKRLRTTLSSLLALGLLLTAAPADTVTLKDGTIIEGKIVSDTPEAIKIEVKVSATIIDEKTIKREDIAEVKKLTEEDIAFEKVQNLIPTPPLLKADDYTELIRSHPQRFLTVYPKSKYTDQVKKVLAELEAEKARTSEGSIKLENTWVTADEQRVNRAGVDAKILLYEMRRQAASADHIAALRTFDRIEKDYLGTESLVTAVGVARKVLADYGATVNSSRSDFAARMKLRMERLQLLPEFRRKQNEAAFASELAKHNATVERDRSQGIRWTAFNPNSEESLTAAAALVAAESKRLKELDMDKLSDAAKNLEQAQAYVEQRKLKGARNSVTKAAELTAGKGKYYAQVLKSVDKLENELKTEAQKAMESDSDRALALVRASKGKEAESASTVNPLKAMMAQRKAEAAKTQAAKDKKGKAKAAAPKPRPAPTIVEDIPPPSGGGLSFQKIIFIVAGLLIVLTLGAVVLQKKKG